MLTRAGAAIAILGTGLLTGGLVLAAPLLLALGTIPFAVLGVGLALPGPSVTAGRIECPERARAGDVVTVRATARVGGGVGLALLSLRLPPEFELVGGSDIRAVPSRARRRDATLELQMRATRRGTFQVGPIDAECVPALHLKSGTATRSGVPVEIEVHPRVVPVRRLRRMRGTATTIAPEEDIARLGLKTTDFREIRAYQRGDPPRTVNWKATARLGPGASFPLVNEYEVEGRKSVFLFLDAGPSLQVGTTVLNGFEAGLGAVSGVALALLDRGYKVGFYAYNAASADVIYPDVGTRQFLKLSRTLARLQPGPGTEGLANAVERCRPWVSRDAPMVVVIARPDAATATLEAGFKRLHQFALRRRRPLVCIAPEPHRLIPPTHERGADAARLVAARSRASYARVRRLGVVVVPWDPATTKLETLLVHGVLAG